MSPYWSYALTALGVAGIFLAGSKKRIGWALGLSAQPLWLVYAVMTGQWGFIASAFVYGGVYLRNWLKWRREARRPATVPSESNTWHLPPWRTHREQLPQRAPAFATGRYPAKPPRRNCPPACGEGHTYDAGCLLATPGRRP